MEDTEITEMAGRIEQASAPNTAVVKYMQYGGGPDESYIVANRAGYLRLAAFFLRAAIVPHEKPTSATIDIDPSGIIDEDSDVGLDWLERKEDFEKVEWQEKLSDRLFPIVGITCLTAVFVLLVIGIVTAIGWLF